MYILRHFVIFLFTTIQLIKNLPFYTYVHNLTFCSWIEICCIEYFICTLSRLIIFKNLKFLTHQNSYMYDHKYTIYLLNKANHVELYALSRGNLHACKIYLRNECLLYLLYQLIVVCLMTYSGGFVKFELYAFFTIRGRITWQLRKRSLQNALSDEKL